MPQAETQEAKTYFAKHGGLTFYVRKPTWINDTSGRAHIDEGPKVEFNPLSDGYGWFTTSDPELIAACEERRLKAKDILTPQEYRQKITPLEKQVEERERKIESQNRLIQDMQKQMAVLTAKVEGGSPSQPRK